MTLTRTQLLDLITRAVECLTEADQDLLTKYGIRDQLINQRFFPLDVRERCREARDVTWKDVAEAIKTPEIPSNGVSEGHRLA
jgi:hypothetical protein